MEVETNLRSFSDPLVGWGKYHGAALASVALLFQHRFRRVLIAATNTYAELFPWGSHPLLDPLWSTELTEIEHDGGEATRFDKMAYISQHEIAMRWLRVCHANPNGAYNCGRCVKCLRTRIVLRTVGALERCKTLPHDLSLEEVPNVELTGDVSRFVVRQTVEDLRRLGTEPGLALALKEALDKSAGESGTGDDAESQHLHQQLSLTQKRLERARARLRASRARSERLAQRNRMLVARYSALRYRVVDVMVGIARRIPGIGKLVRRKSVAD